MAILSVSARRMFCSDGDDNGSASKKLILFCYIFEIIRTCFILFLFHQCIH
ncbi:hypothetical protein MKW92_023732, partial [Papaver armeniacum]